jgi:HAE1 family hydrophobic/amphiphilic exporter-1
VAVADEVKRRIPEMAKQLPQGMRLGVNFDGSQFIKESIDELKLTLLLAVVFTSIVTLLFLGSVRSTIIIARAIPTSIVGTFGVMYFLNFTLNTMTLLALSLSVGVVVDDAILVLENIFRHRELGQEKREAAILGSREITFAAMAATFAVVAIFLPVAFMKGIIGRFFYEFGVTVSVSVLLSLLVALTLTPMLSSRFLSRTTSRFWIFRKTDKWYDAPAEKYKKFLPFTIRHRWIVVGAAVIIFVLSFVLMGSVPKEFVPSQDQSRFMVNIETPVGSSVEYTNSMLLKCEAVLQTMPEIKTYFAAVGIGGAERGVNKAILFVTMLPKNERERSQGEILTFLRQKLNSIPGMKAIPFDLSQSGFTAQRGFPVEFAVRGPNLEKLNEYSGKLMAKMRDIPGVVDVDSDFEIGMPEVRVVPDRKKAADLGVDMAGIGRTVNALIGGTDVAKFKDRGKRYDIRLRLVAQQRATPADIGSILIRNNRGQLISLRDIADIRERPSLQVISRRDRQRAISVFANLIPGTDQQAVLAKVQKLADETLPEGYRISFSGSSQAFKESFQSLIFALFMGILIAYMVLGSQFNHFIHPITVLVALPFSFTGALVALPLAGQSLNIFSMIGLILLMGLVKKNSIIMVDFTNQLRERGEERNEALYHACPVRLRPILMTSVSTIVGALPACLALGPGAESRMPMGIAVVGGLVFSTLLTLFVVPSVYSILDDASARFVEFVKAHRKKPAIAAAD